MWVQSLGPEDSPGGGNGNPLQDLAWRIPWTEESGKLQSTVLQRFGQDCSNLTHTHTQYTHTHMFCITGLIFTIKIIIPMLKS